MTDEQRKRLRNIKTFPQLIAFLRDELDWPIERGEDEDDLTFDWSDDLGLEASAKVGIKEIKQLRPLESGQPWGIFFINFEKKRLPIVILRRILNALVLKKRASANKAQRAAWQQHDLLFISAYGQDDERQLTFAHFSEPTGELTNTRPTLRVLGWDDEDTNLKLDYVADKLKEKLTWPEDTADLKAWRTRWSDAFEFRHRQVINTSEELALRLAELAKRIRGRALRVLEHESEKGALRKLMKGFRTALIHDLGDGQFADMYAQTITYGLFSAAVSRTVPGAGTAVVQENIADMVPVTNPFLKEMLESFLKAGGRKGKLDFDELGIQEVVDLLNDKDTRLDAVLRDFGNKTRQEDPVIHFYEHFLTAYDKKLKVQRGVFYTPQPVVSYIVRSVHELLQTEFGLEDGLASTVTWGEMVKSHAGMNIPEGTSSDQPFVQILDPATGTATFLVEVIDVVHRHLEAKMKKGGLIVLPRLPPSNWARKPDSFQAWWNQYVALSLLPRLHGYELMMAPYAIAHMKIGLKLHETGYRFGTEERARIYLTNSLEPATDDRGQREFEELAPALAHEAQAVNAIKRHQRFTVVIGNPPYSNYGQLNKNPWILGLLEDYKRALGEKKLNLDDDYIKFLRFGQMCVDGSGTGLLGFITNHTYLDGVTHRRLRQSLIESFRMLRLIDLHGSVKKAECCPDGTPDKNVFDIQQGVAIGIFQKSPYVGTQVFHSDLWGIRDAKYQWLNSHSIAGTDWAVVSPTADRFYFVPHNLASDSDYNDFVSIRDAFLEAATGFETARDHFAIGFTSQDLSTRLQDLVGSDSDEVIRSRWGLDDKRDWNLSTARARLRQLKDPLADIRSCCYRPFDNRITHYNDFIVTWPRVKVLSCIDATNPALVAARMVKGEEPNHFFVVNQPTEKIFISGKTSNNAFIFPLYQREGAQMFLSTKSAPQASERKLNLRDDFVARVRSKLALTERDYDVEVFAADIFHYAYAVFHSPGYRTRYAEFLKIDFPRLPLTGKLELFRVLAQLGGELVALHLLESPKLEKPITRFVGNTRTEIEKISYSDKTVWLDKAQTTGFAGVPESVWEFHIGGYQVCEKWLKDRKGRTLSKDDIAHYQKVVVALNETIRLMNEIDEAIDKHGGWPMAFTTGTPH